MKTANQQLGSWGEELVVRLCKCPQCKRAKTLKCLPVNFKCADVICDFCGYLAQVKTATVKDVNRLPSTILGAAWAPQFERMKSGIYFPLFLVLKAGKQKSIFYLPTDHQIEALFSPRKPLSKTARRAGWTGFFYDIKAISEGSFIKVM